MYNIQKDTPRSDLSTIGTNQYTKVKILNDTTFRQYYDLIHPIRGLPNKKRSLGEDT